MLKFWYRSWQLWRAELLAFVGESVSSNKRKVDGQRELQEEAGKSKKKNIALYKFCGFMGWEKRKPVNKFSAILPALMKSLLCIPHSNLSKYIAKPFKLHRETFQTTLWPHYSWLLNLSNYSWMLPNKRHANIIKPTRVQVRPASTAEANA